MDFIPSPFRRQRGPNVPRNDTADGTVETINRPVGRVCRDQPQPLRILIDALGSTDKSGGMRLHASETVRTWAESYSDLLYVVGPMWCRFEFRDLPNVRTIYWPNKSVGVRGFGQAVVTYLAAKKIKPAAVISLSPIVSPLIARRARICVVHDWRHSTHPDEFPLQQRIYRKWWAYSANTAAACVTISKKTFNETNQFAPKAKRLLVVNGGDHARRWIVRTSADREKQPLIVTFGHQTNKRPELVIQALATMPKDFQPSVTVAVLGAEGDYRERLKRLSDHLGVKDQCEFPGFVDHETYQEYIQRASIVALVSSDEGFGLPATEARFLETPLLTTNDSKLEEIHGTSGMYVCPPDPEVIAKCIADLLTSPPINESTPLNQTWRQNICELRAIAVSLRQNRRQGA